MPAKGEKKTQKGQKKERKELQPLTKECTIHLAKLVYNVQFKKRAPRAVREIAKFAAKAMKTKDVRVDQKLNKWLWSQGVSGVPRRVRVRLVRKRNEDEDAKEKLYTLVTHVPVTSYKGLQTKTIEE